MPSTWFTSTLTACAEPCFDARRITLVGASPPYVVRRKTNVCRWSPRFCSKWTAKSCFWSKSYFCSGRPLKYAPDVKNFPHDAKFGVESKYAIKNVLTHRYIELSWQSTNLFLPFIEGFSFFVNLSKFNTNFILGSTLPTVPGNRFLWSTRALAAPCTWETSKTRFTKYRFSRKHAVDVPHAEGTVYQSAHMKRHHNNFEEGKEWHRDKIESFIQHVHTIDAAHFSQVMSNINARAKNHMHFTIILSTSQ